MALATRETFTDYDPLAWFYDRYWGPLSAEQLLPVIERVLLARLPEKARILDLGCGTGHLDQALDERGHEVVGVDGSRAMLAYARNNAPGLDFRLEDARWFEVEEPFDAVISTYETLNHIMSKEELTQVFERVYEALDEDGLFFFDLDMEEAYTAPWPGTDGVVEDDHVLFAQNETDREAHTATSHLTLFRLSNGAWRRTDLDLVQRWYSEDEVAQALAEAGFGVAAIYSAEEDLGFKNETGRTFFLVKKGEDLEPEP